MDKLQQAFADWIEGVNGSRLPPSDIRAINVGLFETSSGYTAYLIGSKEYDASSDDWACHEDYSPEEKYLELPGSFVRGKEWQDIEEEMVETVKDFLQLTKDSENILTKTAIVTVGFDDGVLIRVK